MKASKKTLVAVAAALTALGIGGAAIAGAAGGDDDATDKPIAGQALDQAKAAALDSTAGGRVTETEAGDEEGAYEVEVTRDDGSQVDVHLDKQFNVLGSESDDEKEGAEDD